MCLAIPGKVEKIENKQGQLRGSVNFGGVMRDIDFSCITHVELGQYIIAHAGVALQIIDEDEAQKTLHYLNLLKDNPAE
jgi:hydrogenase expression/formation protein HypC